MKKNTILAMDIGGGTQDILLYDPEDSLENAVKLVLPSPTVMIGRRIAEATRQGKPIFLSGQVMGGGSVSQAIGAHVKAGLKVYAQEGPALTVHDNLEKVKSKGLIIVEEPPEPAVEVVFGDLDLERLQEVFDRYEIPSPQYLALALQDHGYSPDFSNRLTRFRQWQKFLDEGGDIGALIFDRVPEGLSRWAAASETAPGAFFMDTAGAALRGAILDEFAAERLAEGLVVINAGNEHTVAFLIKSRRVFGVYEHHTSLLTKEKLADHMNRFAKGALTHEEIFDEWGHGMAYDPSYGDYTPFNQVIITGPNRRLAKGLGHMAAPYGEMMLSGCFGLIEGVRELAN